MLASGPNSVQHEYSITLDQSAAEAIRNIITLQQVRKFFDFYGISIGQNVSNFSPMFFITFIWFCVFVFPSPTLFREHLSEADNDFVTNNKKLCIQPSPK